jgi:predicted transcriptional regulator
LLDKLAENKTVLKQNGGELYMRRSKLETCICILKVLNRTGSLKITHLMQKADLNFNALQGQLDVLIRLGMVEEELASSEKIVYAITERGANILGFFANLNPMGPTIETSPKCASLKERKVPFKKQNM